MALLARVDDPPEPPASRTAPGGAGRRALPHVLSCLLLAGLPFATSPGNIIADSKFELAVNPAGFLRAALTLWNPQQFGQIQDQVVGYLFPMGPFFELFKLARVDGWAIQRLWLAVVFATAYTGCAVLARKLGIGSPWTRAAGALTYAASPMALGMAGELSAELLPAAMLPWILLPLISGGRRGAILSAVAVALCGGVNGSATFAVVLPAFIYLLMRERRLLAWWLPAVALATSWWVIPLLIQGKYGVSILPYTESAATTTATTGLSNVLRGSASWVPYLAFNAQPWWPLGYQISTGLLPMLATGVIAVIGLAGLMRAGLARQRFWLVCALAGVLIVSAGHAGPLAGPVSTLLNGPASALRNLWKFDPLIRLPVALGVAHALRACRSPAGRSPAGRVHTGWLQATAVAASMTALLVPAFTTGLAAPGAFAAIPSAWTSAARWLTGHAGNQAVLVEPGSAFGQYLWGSPMDDVLQPLTTADYAERDLSVIGSAGNERLLDAIDQRLAAGDGSAGLARVLARMGVRYVVVRNDLVRTGLDGAWPARINDALANSPGITLAATFGSYYGTFTPDDAVSNFDAPYPQVEIYQVAGALPVATVQPATGALRVYGAPEAELTLADEGLLGTRPVLINDDGPGLATTPVVTDSLRRQVRNFGELRTSFSPTLTAAQPLSTFESTTDYTEPGWSRYQAVAQYSGIADVTASSSASDIDAIPGSWASGLFPYQAFAGTGGAWESGSWTGPVGQWLQVDFDTPQDPGSITAEFQNDAAVGPPVSAVTVTTAAGSVTDSLALTGRTQRITVPPGPTAWLRITIARLAASPQAPVGAQVAISGLAIPGVSPGRTILAPRVAGAAVVLSKPQPPSSGCMLTSLRWVCSSWLTAPVQERYGFDQSFYAAGAGHWNLRGRAVLLDSVLAERFTRLHASDTIVSGSSVYMRLPQDQPAAAFDGDPRTAWIAGVTDPHPTLTINWHAIKTVSWLRIARPPGAAGYPLQVLIIGSDGKARGAVVTGSGLVRFAPLRTYKLTLEFSDVQAPLQVTDVTVPGVPFHGPPAGTFRLGCGLGPYLTVDGKVVPTRVSGTFADLVTQQPLTFSACSPVPASAGINRVAEPVSNAFSVQDVVLTAAPLPPARPPAAASVVSWTPSRRVLRVSAQSASFLVVNENYNPGWQAVIGGRALVPVRLDGWKQGWLLPAGTAGLAVLTYQPQSVYADSIIAGLAALALLILLAASPRRPRPRPRLPWVNVAVYTKERVRSHIHPRGSGRRVRVGRVIVPVWGLAGGTCVAVAIGLWLDGYLGLFIVPLAVAALLSAAQSIRSRVLVTAVLAATAASTAEEQLRLSGRSGPGVDALWNTIPQITLLLAISALLACLFSEEHN
jgi:arabinofuranan 3-O-arabinosyltransferase